MIISMQIMTFNNSTAVALESKLNLLTWQNSSQSGFYNAWWSDQLLFFLLKINYKYCNIYAKKSHNRGQQNSAMVTRPKVTTFNKKHLNYTILIVQLGRKNKHCNGKRKSSWCICRTIKQNILSTVDKFWESILCKLHSLHFCLFNETQTGNGISSLTADGPN